jgi:acyl carrier protein
VDKAQLTASLRHAWHDVLEVDVADDSDFYELGGDSLTAAEVATRIVESHPDVIDLDVLTLTAILDDARFDSVVDAICAELGLSS